MSSSELQLQHFITNNTWKAFLMDAELSFTLSIRIDTTVLPFQLCYNNFPTAS